MSKSFASNALPRACGSRHCSLQPCNGAAVAGRRHPAAAQDAYPTRVVRMIVPFPQEGPLTFFLVSWRTG
jgi:hypothetical protein